MNRLLFVLVLLIFGCANVMAPTGGPKDEDPPILENSTPKDGQTNFHGSRLMLEFDEFLKLKNPKEEIIITPDVKDAKFSVKKNIVNIDFGEKLKDSTTYSFAFREAIQDLNEGNPAEDLHIAFSTGNEIDSLQISGNVSQLLKGIPAEKYTVALYQQDTFNLFKHRPVYFTRTDKEGNFRIRNLKAGDYNIYAFEDKNKNLILESKSEKFGIIKDKLTLNENQDSTLIKTIALDSRPITITGIRAIGHYTKVRLNKNLVNYKITISDTNSKYIPNHFSSTQSEIDIFPHKPIPDSTQIRLIGIDSLEQRIDTTFYVKLTDAKSLKENTKLSFIRTQFIDDHQKLTAELTTTEFLKRINPDSIYLQADSTRKISFSMNNIQYDTIFRTIKLEKTFERKDSIKWKQAKLVYAPTSFITINGDTAKTSSQSINYITAEETATLIIESQATVPNVLIEILDDKGNSIGIYPHSKIITVKNIKPGTIQIRRIIDSNKNGKWDPGNPNLKILPEEIIYYSKPDGKKLIPLRANWEVNEPWNF